MKQLIIISSSMFALFVIAYGPWGDYYSDYWNVEYYIVLYFMIFSLFMYVYLYVEGKVERMFIMLFVVYFGVLSLFHIACLFSEPIAVPVYTNGEWREKDGVELALYQKSIPNKAYFNIGTVILTIGILFIKYKLRKKPCRKNLDKNSYGS